MNSRIKNTFKNLFSGVISRFINIILSFLTRTVFIHSLSAEYLGVNGLFSNILTVLSLAEMGFSTAMIYSLYRPLADNDEDKICKIMKLYKKIYFIIGLVVIILGFLIMPWLNNLISTKPNINNISFIYVLYVLNTGVSYFSGAYKKSLLMADQKQYVINFYVNIFYFVKSIIQILILIIFKNFIFYLISQIFVKIFENIFLAKKIDLKYPYILKKTKSTLEKDEIHRIFGDVKALFLTRVGHIMLSGTDNLIITKYIGLFEVGILSNYTLIIDSLSGIIGQITVAATASIGNYIASNDKNESYKLFKKMDFLNYWIYSCCSICLFYLLNPFIKIWLGDSYVFKYNVVFILSLNFLINGLINLLWTFRSTLGLFIQGKYRPIVVGILNIIFSIVFAKSLGVFGVLFATTLTRVAINLWFDPYIIYNYGFKKNVFEYLLIYIKRFFITMIAAIVSGLIIKFIVISNFITFLLVSTILMLSINLIYIYFFRNTEEFKLIYLTFNTFFKTRMKSK